MSDSVSAELTDERRESLRDVRRRLRDLLTDAPPGVKIGHRREERPAGDGPEPPPTGDAWASGRLGVRPLHAATVFARADGGGMLASAYYAKGDPEAAREYFQRAVPVLAMFGRDAADLRLHLPRPHLVASRRGEGGRVHRAALATHYLLNARRFRSHPDDTDGFIASWLEGGGAVMTPPGSAPRDRPAALPACGGVGWTGTPCWSELPGHDALAAVAEAVGSLLEKPAAGRRGVAGNVGDTGDIAKETPNPLPVPGANVTDRWRRRIYDSILKNPPTDAGGAVGYIRRKVEANADIPFSKREATVGNMKRQFGRYKKALRKA